MESTRPYVIQEVQDHKCDWKCVHLLKAQISHGQMSSRETYSAERTKIRQGEERGLCEVDDESTMMLTQTLCTNTRALLQPAQEWWRVQSVKQVSLLLNLNQKTGLSVCLM